MNKLIVRLTFIACLGLPAVGNAIPMTWSFSGDGVCTSSDCIGQLVEVSGSITGDPDLIDIGFDLLSFPEITSYVFNFTGAITDSISGGSAALGLFALDSNGEIAGGGMTFGDLIIAFGGTRVFTTANFWTYANSPGFLRPRTTAHGFGGYTKVPEPGTLGILGLGLLGVGLSRRRARRSASRVSA